MRAGRANKGSAAVLTDANESRNSAPARDHLTAGPRRDWPAEYSLGVMETRKICCNNFAMRRHRRRLQRQSDSCSIRLHRRSAEFSRPALARFALCLAPAPAFCVPQLRAGVRRELPSPSMHSLAGDRLWPTTHSTPPTLDNAAGTPSLQRREDLLSPTPWRPISMTLLTSPPDMTSSIVKPGWPWQRTSAPRFIAHHVHPPRR